MKILIAHNDFQKVKNYCKVADYYNIKWDLYNPNTNLESYDGLLLPGGYDIDPSLYGEAPDETVTKFDKEFDQLQLNILDYFVQNKKPVIGICKGLQIINVYFGGTLIQDIKSNIKHRNADFNDSYHLVNNSDYMEELYGKESLINSMHHQAIKKIGNGLIAVSHSDDQIIEAVRHQSLPIYAVQWHPERTVFDFKKENLVDGFKLFDFFIAKINV